MLRARGSGRLLTGRRNVSGSKDALGSSEHRAVSEDKRRLWNEPWDLKAIVFMVCLLSLETRSCYVAQTGPIAQLTILLYSFLNTGPTLSWGDSTASLCGSQSGGVHEGIC